MKEYTEQILARFRENIKILMAAMPEEQRKTCPAGALLYTREGILADPEAYARAEKTFKKFTGPLSPLRGGIRGPVTARIAMEEEQEDYYLAVLNLYKRFNSGHLLGSEQHVWAAMILLECLGGNSNWTHVFKANELLERMSAEHRFLPDQSELPMAVVWNLTGREQDDMVDEMETNTRLLKGHFKDVNLIPAPAELLVLDPTEPEKKCEQLLKSEKELRERDIILESGHELAVLALLLMTGETDLSEFTEIDSILTNMEEAGDVFADAKFRHLYAGMLAALSRIEKMEAGEKKDAALHAERVCRIMTIVNTSAAGRTRR